MECRNPGAREGSHVPPAPSLIVTQKLARHRQRCRQTGISRSSLPCPTLARSRRAVPPLARERGRGRGCPRPRTELAACFCPVGVSECVRHASISGVQPSCGTGSGQAGEGTDRALELEWCTAWVMGFAALYPSHEVSGRRREADPWPGVRSKQTLARHRSRPPIRKSRSRAIAARRLPRHNVGTVKTIFSRTSGRAPPTVKGGFGGTRLRVPSG